MTLAEHIINNNIRILGVYVLNFVVPGVHSKEDHSRPTYIVCYFRFSCSPHWTSSHVLAPAPPHWSLFISFYIGHLSSLQSTVLEVWFVCVWMTSSIVGIMLSCHHMASCCHATTLSTNSIITALWYSATTLTYMLPWCHPNYLPLQVLSHTCPAYLFATVGYFPNNPAETVRVYLAGR